ncbi:hypothetical protein M3P05_11530 [Sansalvadorimonas sp. 2012CJ34-2]|uniref:Uncharacterized protein n=1 Tax=Parendozoicomonas callyspongiae TaxID=2942213 RepID=A0ABT0PGS0_9GAMM|nr:hypothetical protein [Sansalvadorimonas sp. 2012CJ34-2]MCL6270554.1 hypothetical protein [Sansalvadorimonas sp. 2012CJ34-2]
MSSAIGDISSGLVGVSHTTGDEYKALPSKSAIKPAGSTITVHTEKALAKDDSTNQLMKFVRGERLQSYTPQDNRDLRNGLLELSDKTLGGELSEADQNDLNEMVALLKQDSELEMLAQMARNILIPA